MFSVKYCLSGPILMGPLKSEFSQLVSQLQLQLHFILLLHLELQY